MNMNSNRAFPNNSESSQKTDSSFSSVPPSSYSPSFYVKIMGISQFKVSDSSGNQTELKDGMIVSNNAEGLSSCGQIGEDALLMTMTASQEHTVQFLMEKSLIYLEIIKGIGNRNPDLAVRYRDIFLPPETPMRIVLTADGKVESLYSDSDKDGVFESIIEPTANVTGSGARDLQSPFVNISALRQDNAGTVAIDAQDDESGVKFIRYSINGYNNFVVYSQPFTVDASKPVTIYAFAEDNAANRSSIASQTFFANTSKIK